MTTGDYNHMTPDGGGRSAARRSWRFQPSGQREFSFRYKPLFVAPQEVDPRDDGGHGDYAYKNSDRANTVGDRGAGRRGILFEAIGRRGCIEAPLPASYRTKAGGARYRSDGTA
jgi:hypothetical protein